MRISHSDLESCSTNPSTWAKNRLNRSESDFIPRGYDGFTKLAIFSFHKTGSEGDARAKLSSYLSHFSSPSRKETAKGALSSYIAWYYSEKPIVVAIRVRLGIDIGFNNTLVGEVSRVDVQRAAGYRGILLGSIPANWTDQLRMPLIQLGLAQLYKRSADEIEVGWQDLSGRPIRTKCYTDREIRSALKEVERISKSVYEEVFAHTSDE
jgi:hypothetical protein